MGKFFLKDTFIEVTVIYSFKNLSILHKFRIPERIWSIVAIAASVMMAELVWLLHHVGMKETNHTLLVTNDNRPRKRPQNVDDLIQNKTMFVSWLCILIQIIYKFYDS